MKLAVLPLALLGIAACALWPLPGLFVWSALALASSLARVAVLARRRPARGACVGLSVVLLAFGAVEALLWRRAARDRVPECEQTAEYPSGYFEPFHEVLGYAPTPGRTTHSVRVCEGEVLYDVHYTIDARGLRVSPPSAAREGVLCFGGSFTFGEGVRDEQAMPYQLGLRTAERLRVDNFGFQGYGPHQMLRALETGYVERIVPARPVACVYQMILLHVRRSAGMEAWDVHGPRYVLRDDGGVEHAGRFSDVPRSALDGWLREHSHLYARLSGRTDAGDLELAIEIVDAARREVDRRFPGASFHVLLWDEARAKSDALEAGLRRRGLEVIRVSDILPGAREDDTPYILGPYDMHPSADAHARIAEHLARVLLGERAATSGN